jgi:GNAT superfamily N-acetyltransferase
MLLAIGGRAPWPLFQRIVHRYLWRSFSECVLGADVADSVELPPQGLAVATMPMTPGTLEELLALGPPQIDKETAAARFRRGDHGVAAKANGRIVSSVWIGGGVWRLRDLGLEVRLAPDQGMLYDAYTAPDVRRLGIMALLVRACVEHAKARGTRWLFARAVTTNANTMSTLGRAGFKEILTINGVLLTNAIGFYRISGRDIDRPAPRALMSNLVPLRPGLVLWDVDGRRGIKILVPRPWRRSSPSYRQAGTSE